MFKKSFFILLFALSMSTFVAAAQPPYVNVEQRFTPEQMHETGLDSLSSAQLLRLNQLLGEQAATQLKVEQAATQLKVEQAVAQVKAEKPSAPGTPGQGNFIGMGDGPIKSQLVGTISGWDVDTVFELTNGQKWKVLKGYMKLRKPMQSPEIIVVPGIAGRWFLQVDEDLPKARVYRID